MQKTRADFSDPTIKEFINFSFHDYIAARTLLMANMPTQGTILGVTALEKLMKAICLLHNESINVGGAGHALGDLVSTIKKHQVRLLLDEDVEFIKHIEKAYKLRYPDNLSEDFELFLPSLKLLVNLDRVYCKLTTSEKVVEINPHKKMFDVYKNRNDQSLVKCNVHFNPGLLSILSVSNQKYAHYTCENGNSLKEEFCWSNKFTQDGSWGKPD